ncbi:disulfide bond formation protein B [Helicobacter sp. 16-1353]|uniref:protein-disulfide oxidoreductase DsbI n=1 Tax=Helicobacter sp. 16-1353 TaxID=2004996 RepID=UPI000DCD3D2C|nr:protein-disulfide oxidoreductase DsbI [Helicobacter sp. 16-1353]RAX53187.1 disulfide bond formation protein B [Helicobacter sp. 16-1353]
MSFFKRIWRDFKESPIKQIAKWQDCRFLWLLMTFVSLALVIVAHSLFQHYVYMAPCEQCVYIRFAFFVMFFGGVIAAIKPSNVVLKLIGYVLGFYGIIKGLMFSVKLNAIHKAVHSDDPFGVQGCSAEPTFPFGLPLDAWFPDWFKPTGDCGYDNPIVPEGVELSSLQQWLVDFYSEGWYLVPKYHFMNMAQACGLAYGVCLIALGAMFVCWVITAVRKS